MRFICDSLLVILNCMLLKKGKVQIGEAAPSTSGVFAKQTNQHAFQSSACRNDDRLPQLLEKKKETTSSFSHHIRKIVFTRTSSFLI
jgi:hypothetical protein